jgi:PAS domain S-box-containing protein
MSQYVESRLAKLEAENARLRQQIADLEQHISLDYADVARTSLQQEQHPDILPSFLTDTTLLQIIIDTIPHLVFAQDRKGRLIYANRHLADLFGQSQEQLLGQTAYDLYPPDAACRIHEAEQHVLAMGATVDTEIVVPVGGEQHTYRSTLFPLFGINGSIYGTGGFAVDVTAYKQTEIALGDSQKLLSALIEHVPASLVVKNLAGQVLFANRHAAAAHQYTREEMVGKTATELFPPRFAQIIVAAEQQAHKTRIPFESELVWPTGSRVFSSVHFPIYDATGELHAIGAMAIDITKRKQAQEQMLQQQQALAVLRERERLARELHDDMGQVIGTLQMQSQTIQKLLEQGNIDAAQHHVHDLIAVSRQGNDSVRDFIFGVRVHIADSDRWFDALGQYLRRFHELYGIQVELNVSPEIDMVQDDVITSGVEIQVLRIIQEALTNVRKHTSAQDVQIDFMLQHEWLYVYIRDNGQGFDPGEAATQQGYGLRSMHARAAEIGGHVRIKSKPGVGTTVIVQIPRSMQPVLDNVRILIVDDHPLFLLGLRNMLVAHGLNVIATAHNGEEAIQQAHLLHPDIVLMDIQMPQLGGLDAARQIKAELPDIRIVMLSMFDDDANLFESLKIGASGYLPKNLDSDEFLRLLRGLLHGEVALEARMVARVLAEFGQQDAHDEAPARPSHETPNTLSARQIEVLTLVASGHTYREVGDQLGFSERTVKYHMGEIIKRLHLRNRAEAIAYATQQGWLKR